LVAIKKLSKESFAKIEKWSERNPNKRKNESLVSKIEVDRTERESI
jgi:hypothetical protein